MRIAAIYDVHGNLRALEAVFERIAAAPVDRMSRAVSVTRRKQCHEKCGPKAFRAANTNGKLPHPFCTCRSRYRLPAHGTTGLATLLRFGFPGPAVVDFHRL